MRPRFNSLKVHFFVKFSPHLKDIIFLEIEKGENMEVVVTVIFLAVALAIGIGYLKFSKRISEELIEAVKFRRRMEMEGGDNWPKLQLEIFSFDSNDNLTSADFEKENTRSRSKEDQFCHMQ